MIALSIENKIEEQYTLADLLPWIVGRRPSWVWNWSKTRKQPALLMSQKRIAPSHPPVSKTHSFDVDHWTENTPAATNQSKNRLLSNWEIKTSGKRSTN